MAKRRLPDELMFLAEQPGHPEDHDASMAGKVCVVSGATSGVGLEAVKRLARGGAHIVMVCRNPDKAESDSRRSSWRSTACRSTSSSPISPTWPRCARRRSTLLEGLSRASTC